MRDIDQVTAALRRRHSDVRVEQRPIAHAAIDEEIWFINLPSSSIEVQLESPTGNCPFLVESNLSPERLHAATVGETINMVSSMLEVTAPAAPRQIEKCELCYHDATLFETPLAYVAPEKNSLSRGHVIAVPKRHVADFFDLTSAEQASILELLNQARESIQREHRPDGYNIGVNVGKAAGQARMHVHVHLIPRYAGDVPDPRGGIRCVLPAR